MGREPDNHEDLKPFTAEERQELRRLTRSSRRKWRMFSVWIVLFSIVVILGIHTNHNRIKDIQKSRVYSCQQNYASFEIVFKPFLPTKDDPATKRNEITDKNKFLDLIHRREKQCVVQVNTTKKVKTIPKGSDKKK